MDRLIEHDPRPVGKETECANSWDVERRSLRLAASGLAAGRALVNGTPRRLGFPPSGVDPLRDAAEQREACVRLAILRLHESQRTPIHRSAERA